MTWSNCVSRTIQIRINLTRSFWYAIEVLHTRSDNTSVSAMSIQSRLLVHEKSRCNTSKRRINEVFITSKITIITITNSSRLLRMQCIVERKWSKQCIEALSMLLEQVSTLHERFFRKRFTHCLDQTSIEIFIKMRKDNSFSLITRQDIYNAKKIIRAKRLNKYTFTKILLKILHRENWFIKIQLNEKINQVRRLFFVNKHVKEMLCKNFEIIVMNCIYKTNKYKMSLLVIMSHTALSTSFYIDFAFLESEKEKNFAWVLQQLKALYISLDLKNSSVIVIDRDLTLMKVIETQYSITHNVLCIWHINKNVLKNCKSLFVTQKQWEKFLIVWYKIVYAHIRDEYKAIWRELCIKYNVEHEAKIKYLKCWKIWWLSIAFV